MRRSWVSIAAFALGASLLHDTECEARARHSGAWHSGARHSGARHSGAWRGGASQTYAGGGLGSAATSRLGSGYRMLSPDVGPSGWNWPIYTHYNPIISSSRVPSYYAAYPAALAMIGRSGASGRIGMHCSTPVKTCLLRNASHDGVGCSCKVDGGRAPGLVVP
jgi:hypothetical protein